MHNSAERIARQQQTITELRDENKKLREALSMKLVDLNLAVDKHFDRKATRGTVSVSFTDLELVLAAYPRQHISEKLHAALDILIESAAGSAPAKALDSLLPAPK